MTTLTRADRIRVAGAGRAAAQSAPRSTTSAVVAFTSHTAPYVHLFARSGREFDPLPFHESTSAANGIAFSPDGQHFAAAITPRVGRTNLGWWRRVDRQWVAMPAPEVQLAASKRMTDIKAGDLYLDPPSGALVRAADFARYFGNVVVDGFFRNEYRILGDDGINRFYVNWGSTAYLVVHEQNLGWIGRLRWSPASNRLAALRLRYDDPGSAYDHAALPTTLNVFELVDDELVLLPWATPQAALRGCDLTWLDNDTLAYTTEPFTTGVL